MGESNGDHVFWGAKGQHWAERQAFLLGAKFDVISYTLRFPKETQAMELAIAERKRVSLSRSAPTCLQYLSPTSIRERPYRCTSVTWRKCNWKMVTFPSCFR